MKKGIVFTEGRGDETPAHLPIDRAFQGVTDIQPLLQNAFTSLFEQEIPDLKTIFLFEMNGGWKSALFAFVKALSSERESMKCLLIDYSDIPGNNLENKRISIQSVLKEKSQNSDLIPLLDLSQYYGEIYFMVQMMESWILSQPHVIEQCFGNFLPEIKKVKFEKKKAKQLSKEVQDIQKPDKILSDLLGYFEKPNKHGLPRTFKYEKGGKVKLAYEMLSKLSLKKLMEDFEDVRNLVAKIRACLGIFDG
jgi:hypothetical protein